MNDTVVAALLAALVTAVGGLLVPMLIARVPEPAPKPTPEAVDEADADAVAGAGAEAVPATPKMLYADIAARPGLAWRSALVSAVCGALLGAATGLDWPLLWLVPLTPVAVALSVIDWHTRLLPRVVVLPATLAVILVMVVVALATAERDALVRALIGMLAARSFFWVLWWLRSAGMGFGDVRLAAPVGLVLGWAGGNEVALGLWSAFVLFAVPALVVVIVRRDRSLLKRSFPFGPFMVVGALAGLVWGTVSSWPFGP